MSITLVSISNINHELTEFSINRSLETFGFQDAFLMSDRPLSGVRYLHQEYIIDNVIQFEDGRGNRAPWSFDSYNIFLLKHLVHHIRTDHIINIHYDGFCVNSQHWCDEFLEYDFIGPLAHRDWFPLVDCLKNHNLYDLAPDTWFNGGGGFTLRSKKLLQALLDPRISTELSEKNLQRAEDMTITLKYRKLLEQDYGIRFAPAELCLKWCTELLSGLPFSFGFHGWQNIPQFLSEDECIWYVERLNRKDIFLESPVVKKYQALCYLQNYRRAGDQIQSLIQNNAEIARRHSLYSR